MLRASDFPVTNHYLEHMKAAGFRPSNHRIAILFMAFMACCLTLLCYQSRLSHLAPIGTAPIIKSIRMTHERNTSGALEDEARDDSGNKQFDHAPGAVSDNEIPATILSPASYLPDLHLDLITASVYRRPPPTRL